MCCSIGIGEAKATLQPFGSASQPGESSMPPPHNIMGAGHLEWGGRNWVSYRQWRTWGGMGGKCPRCWAWGGNDTPTQFEVWIRGHLRPTRHCENAAPAHPSTGAAPESDLGQARNACSSLQGRASWCCTLHRLEKRPDVALQSSHAEGGEAPAVGGTPGGMPPALNPLPTGRPLPTAWLYWTLMSVCQ